MDTNALKKFAQAARNLLIDQHLQRENLVQCAPSLSEARLLVAQQPPLLSEPLEPRVEHRRQQLAKALKQTNAPLACTHNLPKGKKRILSDMFCCRCGRCFFFAKKNEGSPVLGAAGHGGI